MMMVEDAGTVLNLLLAKGVITEKQVRAVSGYTMEEVKQANLLHSIFCRKDHGEGKCKYYEAGPKKLVALQEWIENVRNLAVVAGMEAEAAVKLAAEIAGRMEHEKRSHLVIMRAFMTVHKYYTLKEFLADEVSEAPEGTERSESLESAETEPQTPPPPQEEGCSPDQEKPEHESPDQAEPRPTTSDDSESP